MLSRGVIQEYIVDINFSILGYGICYIVTKQEEKNTAKVNISNTNINRRKKIIEHLARFGDILAEIEVLGGSSIFRIATKASIHKEIQLKDYNKINSSLPETWLMRDLWQTTNMNYGARWGLAKNPKRLKSSGVKRLLERAIWEQGIRQPLKEGTKRHE